MDEERKSEIAHAFLGYVLAREGLRLDTHFRRKLGHVAKETGIPVEELTDFCVTFIGELVEKYVKPKPKK